MSNHRLAVVILALVTGALVAQPALGGTIVPAACPSVGPTLVSPANGTTVESPITFKWQAVAGATDYDVFVAGDNGVTREIHQTSTQAGDTLPVGHYVWYVKASASSCTSTVSAEWSFDVTAPCPVSAPTLLSPADGSTVDLPFVFKWSAVSGAEKYVIHITGPNGFIRDIPTPLTQAPDDNYPPGTYIWKVEVLATGCTSLSSTAFSFVVTSNCPTVGPTLTSPAQDAAVTSPVEFSWDPVSGAGAYELLVFDDYGLVDDEKFTGTSATLALDPGNYDWYVLAGFDSSCVPAPSKQGHFSVTGSAGCGVSGPALVSPGDSSDVVNPVNLTWGDVTGATGYELIVVGLDNDTYKVVDTDSGVTTASLILDPGQYVWFVDAELDCGKVESQDAYTFTIGGGANCPSAGPVLTSPADEAELSLPATFEWQPVDGAIGYWLVLITDDGVPTVVAKTEPGVTSATLDSIPSGDYEWAVVALLADCDPVFSEDRSFDIAFDPACDHDEPYLLLPIDGSANVPSPVTFSWTPVDGATSYKVWASSDGVSFSEVGSPVTSTTLSGPVPEGSVVWYVEADFDGCAPTESEWGLFDAAGAVACGTPPRVVASAVGSAASGDTYTLRWSAVANGDSYDVQESATNDFADPATQTTTDLSLDFSHEVTTTSTWTYRVRGVASCDGSKGNWSVPVAVTVTPPAASSGKVDYASAFGSLQAISQTLFIPGTGGSPVVGKIAPRGTLTRRRPVHVPTDKTFSVTADQSWITVSPSSGSLPPAGTNVVITMDPKKLPAGSSGGTVVVDTSYGSAKVGASATTGAAVPVSLSLVTPVSPALSTATPADAIVLPTLASSANVVIGNLSADALKYQVSFSRESGGGTRQTSVQVSPGSTSELDKALATWFGGGLTDPAGSLVINTVGAATSTAAGPTTVASALAFASAPGGTVERFVPGTALSRFAGKPVTSLRPTTLTVPAVRKNGSFATDLVLVEGSGHPATADVSISSSAGTRVDEFTVDLAAREQKTIADVLGSRGLSIDGARIDVDVTSARGKVLALGSVRDVTSGDSWIIAPASASDAASTRWVIPGVADVAVTEGKLESDVWIVNRGASSVDVTLRFDPEGDATAPDPVALTLQPGETKMLERVVSTSFGMTGTWGAIQVGTAAPASLIVGGRTYLDRPGGSLGSVVPAATIEQTAAMGSRSLQILHIENSDRLRTDLGLAEVSGSAATVEITATVPGALASPKITVNLKANEFKRLQSVLESMGLGRIYGGRLSIRVTGGSGRVAAYGELVDLASGEPTFVPAE